jgi:hypothetical protein
MTNTIAFVTAIAPYVTAIVAIAGSFVTAWLAQRSWGKQFEAQYQLELLKERIKICQEIPDQLFQAQMSHMEASAYQIFLYALGQVAAQFETLGVDVKPWMSLFREKNSAALSIPMKTYKDTWRSLVRLDLYFGPEAMNEFRGVLAALQKAAAPREEYVALREKTVAAFTSLVEEMKMGKVVDFGAEVFSLFTQFQREASGEEVAFQDAITEFTFALRKQLVSEGVGQKHGAARGAKRLTAHQGGRTARGP